MKVIVKSDFFDLEKNVMRYEGEEMEVTKDRLNALGDFVEKVKAKNEKSET